MNLAFQRKIKQDNRVYSVVLSTKKACGSFFKLHEKCCFTISTLSQSDNRLYFYEEPHNFYTFLNTQDRNI